MLKKHDLRRSYYLYIILNHLNFSSCIYTIDVELNKYYKKLPSFRPMGILWCHDSIVFFCIIMTPCFLTWSYRSKVYSTTSRCFAWHTCFSLSWRYNTLLVRLLLHVEEAGDDADGWKELVLLLGPPFGCGPINHLFLWYAFHLLDWWLLGFHEVRRLDTMVLETIHATIDIKYARIWSEQYFSNLFHLKIERIYSLIQTTLLVSDSD